MLFNLIIHFRLDNRFLNQLQDHTIEGQLQLYLSMMSPIDSPLLMYQDGLNKLKTMPIRNYQSSLLGTKLI